VAWHEFYLHETYGVSRQVLLNKLEGSNPNQCLLSTVLLFQSFLLNCKLSIWTLILQLLFLGRIPCLKLLLSTRP